MCPESSNPVFHYLSKLWFHECRISLMEWDFFTSRSWHLSPLKIFVNPEVRWPPSSKMPVGAQLLNDTLLKVSAAHLTDTACRIGCSTAVLAASWRECWEWGLLHPSVDPIKKDPKKKRGLCSSGLNWWLWMLVASTIYILLEKALITWKLTWPEFGSLMLIR